MKHFGKKDGLIGRFASRLSVALEAIHTKYSSKDEKPND
jgi:hypothetical protein